MHFAVHSAAQAASCIGCSDEHGAQGTNAHVVLEAVAPQDGAAPLMRASPQSRWLRLRHWFVPLLHPLLRTVAATGAAVKFSGPSHSIALAYLGELALGGYAAIQPAVGLEVG